MPVSVTYADYLQAPALYETAANATAAARWGDLALDRAADCGLATQAGAASEAARQIAFFGDGPIALDEHLIVGLRRDLLGQMVTMTGPELGYSAGVNVLVIDAAEDRSANLTTLLVLRRL